ncbi:hypothetical protein ES705_46236 [subsurface metagenome]
MEDEKMKQRFKELKETELKEIEEVEKLTIDELMKRKGETRRKMEIIQMAIIVRRTINVYEKEGFRGLFIYKVDNDIPF